MNIELSTDLESFVLSRVADGSYATHEDVIREAFKLLERREQLLRQIDTGTNQLRNGDYTEFDEESLREFFDQIQLRGQRRCTPCEQGP